MNKFKRYFPIVYLSLLIIGFLYIKNVLQEDVLTVDEADKTTEKTKEIKPVDVYLTVVSEKQNSSYKLRKENDETFDDFIEDLVDSSALTYEKTEYTYGTTYDKINGEKAPEGYEWKVYADDEEITYKTKGVKLEDETTYRFILDVK